MKCRNAFTLVELLAVIVILAIILVIAVPKITDTIKKSKIASFESSAKTIAAQAEKKKMENEILDNNNPINCNNLVKLSNSDYISCSIYFDGNTAKVTLIGKGKFEGLQIINGTKESATATDATSSTKKGVNFIKELYDDEEKRTANGLKKDNTVDENIRYEGANPNNYVKFNNELWRIIGVFGDNIKLVRSEKLGELSWDSSDSLVNGGSGVNEWSQADLKEYLNTMYYGGTSVTCYGGSKNATTTCPIGSLNVAAKSMIKNYIWNTGAINVSDTNIVNLTTYAYNTVAFYNAERGSVNGKICPSGNYCNDTVERTTLWQGYVALPYITDWAYASSETACITNMNDGYDAANNNFDNMTCRKNNWMHYGSTMNEGVWMLAPFALYDNAGSVWGFFSVGIALRADASNTRSVFPSVYLNSDVKITSGSGSSSDPYILSV